VRVDQHDLVGFARSEALGEHVDDLPRPLIIECAFPITLERQYWILTTLVEVVDLFPDQHQFDFGAVVFVLGDPGVGPANHVGIKGTTQPFIGTDQHQRTLLDRTFLKIRMNDFSGSCRRQVR